MRKLLFASSLLGHLPFAAREVSAEYPTRAGGMDGGLLSITQRFVHVPDSVWADYHEWKRKQFGTASKRPLSRTNVFSGEKAEAALRRVQTASVFGLPMLRPNMRGVVAWLAFMLMVDMLYTAFCVPIQVAFCLEDFADLHNWCAVVDLIAGSIYLLNMLSMFQIGVIIVNDFDRELVMSGRHVAWWYVRYGQFIIDTMSVVPFVYLVIVLSVDGQSGAARPGSFLNLISLLRLGRMGRLVNITRVIYSDLLSGRMHQRLSRFINPNILHVVILLYFVSFFVNLYATLLVLVANLEGVENSWMSAVSWTTLHEASGPWKWVVAVYWVVTAMTTTGFGDVSPRRISEMLIIMVVMISGMMLFGLLVSTMGGFLQRATHFARKAQEKQSRMTELTEWLASTAVDTHVQTHVQTFFANQIQETHDPIDTWALKALPPTLRGNLVMRILRDVLPQVPAFKHVEQECLFKIATRLIPQHVVADVDIISEGQDISALYILPPSSCVQVIPSMNGQDYPQCMPDMPCLLGGVAMYADIDARCRHSLWGYRTLSELTVWRLKLEDVRPIMTLHPKLRSSVINSTLDSMHDSLAETYKHPWDEVAAYFAAQCAHDHAYTGSWRDLVHEVKTLSRSGHTLKLVMAEVLARMFDERMHSRPTESCAILSGGLDSIHHSTTCQCIACTKGFGGGYHPQAEDDRTTPLPRLSQSSLGACSINISPFSTLMHDRSLRRSSIPGVAGLMRAVPDDEDE